MLELDNGVKWIVPFVSYHNTILSYILMVLCTLSTAFMQSHFILKTISHGQCDGICNEMGGSVLECLMNNIIKK